MATDATALIQRQYNEVISPCYDRDPQCDCYREVRDDRGKQGRHPVFEGGVDIA
jgi:hypothetical protein